MLPWALSLPWKEINAAAAAHGLSPKLVAAIIQTESGGVAAKTRYERAWSRFVDPDGFAVRLGISKDTEVIAQAHSYGVLQIMGATARGLGFTGYCSSLIGLEAGLDWGCRYLAAQAKRFPIETDLIASYNAGTPRDANHDGVVDNARYVRDVLARLAELDIVPS